MYRRTYQISNCVQNLKVSNDTSEDSKTDDDDEIDESVRNQVTKVWLDIEQQCNNTTSPASEKGDSDDQSTEDWNVVRVFVSSTFTDFFNEREVLVKKVFPELREWCQDRGLKLVECDLRWGVPKDSSTSDTILICLDEIERCRQTNKGKPFFINLSGERYGWIPSVEETPAEAKEKYNWVEGTSITFMEIMHGAFRERNPNAAFFLRDKSVCDDIPQAQKSRFIDGGQLAQHHLKVMKRKLRERFPDQVFPYSCKFQQVSMATGREQVELAELDDFAQKVLQFLKKSIEKMYPNPVTPEDQVDLFEQEQKLQWLFVLDKARDLIGRQMELDILKEFVERGTSEGLEKPGSGEGEGEENDSNNLWDLHETDTKMCVVEGASGFGKTALLCKLTKEIVEKKVPVFYHFINSSPDSNQVEFLLKRFVRALKPDLTEDEWNQVNEANDEDLQSHLKSALSNFRGQTEKKLIVIIDGLNEMENSDTTRHLSWLPPSFPHNINCIVSTNSHPPTTARVYDKPTFKMHLQNMLSEDLSAVAVRYLADFNKKLDYSQLEKLLSNTGVDNPLWMMLMAEELRVFGDFRLLDSKIANFPSDMSGLLSQIINRLIDEDDEYGVIKKVLCLIACSRHGLPTDKVLQICGDIEKKEELAAFHWARARRILKPYIRQSGHVGGTITFAHEAVLKAVQEHLLNNDNDRMTTHSLLADFYQYWCNDGRAKAYHVPYHLEAAFLRERLLDFIQNDADSYFYMHQFQRSFLLQNLRCRGPAHSNMPGAAPVMLCHSCSMFTRGWNPGCNWQNKDCCAVCGALCQGPMSSNARACMRHAQSAGPDMVKCVLCNFQVNTKVKSGPLTPTPAKLCMNCSIGLGSDRCARFDV